MEGGKEENKHITSDYMTLAAMYTRPYMSHLCLCIIVLWFYYVVMYYVARAGVEE